jgi:anti-sigma B factor antagonist
MEINVINYRHCDVITVRGRVDSATAPQFASALDEIINLGHYKIVLDFSEVEFMSSAGLRVLINSQKTCKRYNRGEVVLACVNENLHKALTLAGFTRLFKIYAEVLPAVGSF